MPQNPVIIAVDGYSSTGKSSFAKMIARAYGLPYLDSGALYRAVTLAAMEKGVISEKGLNLGALAGLLDELDVNFKFLDDGRCLTCLGDRDVENEIRAMSVSSNVSVVAAESVVRDYVTGILRRFGSESGLVMDGRDIGTAVFPNAGLKLFMTADPAVRARRRQAELEAKGIPADFTQVLENLKKRDWQDSHRQVSPLLKASDAIVLDNTEMTPDDQMRWLEGIMYEKFKVKPLKI